jgi:hypothetical protein
MRSTYSNSYLPAGGEVFHPASMDELRAWWRRKRGAVEWQLAWEVSGCDNAACASQA